MTKNKNWRSMGWCEVHNKHLYESRKVARQVGKLHQGEHKSPFLCGDDHVNLWHIGGLPKAIIDGRYTREDLYGHAA